MLYNGELPSSPGIIYTAPLPTPAIRDSGDLKTINLFRIVNEADADRMFTIWVNVNGTPRPITPLNTSLPPGWAYDDFPTFQISAGATIEAYADGADVSWTINAQ